MAGRSGAGASDARLHLGSATLHATAGSQQYRATLVLQRSTVRQYFWNFLGALAHGGRHVALEPLCCGEDKHSTPVLSGALLPYPSTTAPAHPPYPSLRIDPAQPHLNSRPQP